MKNVDIVFIKQGKKKLLGVGRITSTYFYYPTREDYRSIREIEWFHVGEWELEQARLTMKTMTIISHDKELSQT